MVKNYGRQRAKKKRKYNRRKDNAEFEAFGKPREFGQTIQERVTIKKTIEAEILLKQTRPGEKDQSEIITGDNPFEDE